MTPEELRAYWNTFREPKQQELFKLMRADPVKALSESAQLAALNFMIESYLETFKPQG